jgi:RNAse (barnase) inhibitor barstar
MNVPDLTQATDSGMRDWPGPPDALKAAAAAAKLRYCVVDLHGIGGKTELMTALARDLKLPDHFGSNWDALADVLEDSDWLGKNGIVIVLRHTAAYRKAHAADWDTFSDILSEAAEYWHDVHKPLWVFVG